MTIQKAILKINPNAEFTTRDNEIEWHNGTTPISKELILAKQAELQALEYVYENRRNEYGSVVSQLDEIYHNGIDSWKAIIQSIKTKYPK